jgi:hypothetical protein
MKKSIILFLIIILTFTIENLLGQTVAVYGNGINLGTYTYGSTVYVAPGFNSISFNYTGSQSPFNNAQNTYWTLNGSGSVSSGSYFHNQPVSSCEELNVTFHSYSYNVLIYIVRLKSPNINGPSRLCQGQSGNFDTQYLDDMDYNWSGTSGISVSSNQTQAFVSMGTSSGKIFCTASNQCGSRTEYKYMGVPNEGEINVSGIPYQNTMTPGSSVDLHTWGNNGTSWSTNHGYFSYQSWNQNTSGESVIYTASYGVVNVIYVTQSNSCGAGTRTLIFNINQWGGNSFMASDLEVFPNPTQNALNVRLSKKDNFDGKNNISVPEKIALYDKNGSLIRNIDDSELKEMAANRKLTIDVTDLAPNEYYLHVTDKQGKVEKVRVIVGDKR